MTRQIFGASAAVTAWKTVEDIIIENKASVRIFYVLFHNLRVQSSKGSQPEHC
jgi:DNA/RNA-binding domain of Phe-tRNA-synthetase-like protein